MVSPPPAVRITDVLLDPDAGPPVQGDAATIAAPPAQRGGMTLFRQMLLSNHAPFAIAPDGDEEEGGAAADESAELPPPLPLPSWREDV